MGALYTLLALLLTYPLILNFARAVPGHGADDPYLAWNIWWARWSLLDVTTNPLFSNYIFYPIGVNLGSYTLTLLNGILSIPPQLAWDVIPADNLIILFSISLAAFGAYLLVRDTVGDESNAAQLGAITAGLVYGFGAYRFNYLYLGHFNFNSNEWLPFYALYMQRVFKQPSGAPKAGLMAGLFFVFTLWSEATLAAFIVLLTGCYLLFRLVFERSKMLRRAVLLNMLALGGVAFAGLLPLLWAVGNDIARYGNFLFTGPGRAEFLSADLLSFVIPSQWNPLLGFLSRDLPFHNMDFAFVGYVTLFLAIIGWVAFRSRIDAAFWGVAAVLFAAVMLGPVLHVANQSLNSVPLPFSLVQSVPLLGANRLPVRYNEVLMLAMAVLSGAGSFVLFKRFSSPRIFFALIPGLILVEHLGLPISLSDLEVPAVYRTIAAQPGDFSVLDLPLSWSSSTLIQGDLYTQSQFYQTVHHKRLLGGNTSRPPPFEFQYFNELPVIHSIILLEEGEAIDDSTVLADTQAAPELARFFDLRYVVERVDKTDAQVLDFARRVFALTPVSDEGEVRAYSVSLPQVGDFTIDQGSGLSKMYFDNDWGRAQTGTNGMAYRWASSSGSLLFAPLSAVDYQMCGWYAGSLDGQKLNISVNDADVAELDLVTSWERRCLTLPGRLLRAGMNTIRFETGTMPLATAGFAEDRHIGKTGVTAPADIAVTSAGFLAGKFASITFNGRETYASRRGFYLMSVDPNRPDASMLQVFDTFRDESESARLAEFVRTLPAGVIVAGAVSDEASLHLTQAAVDALGTLGLDTDMRSRFRASYAFVGVKGARPGTALEAADSSLPANVSVGKNVSAPTVAFALGTVQFTRAEK